MDKFLDSVWNKNNVPDSVIDMKIPIVNTNIIVLRNQKLILGDNGTYVKSILITICTTKVSTTNTYYPYRNEYKFSLKFKYWIAYFWQYSVNYYATGRSIKVFTKNALFILLIRISILSYATFIDFRSYQHTIFQSGWKNILPVLVEKFNFSKN